ncbi:hypothetical protein DFA_09008 [Cavenderia fasciculata]|uniref:Transmembrane protein n=1 Tax=Cavenderia fasciculata TaxID=261658 RepID=F4Q6G0_CACFS|nr:uncharacterized protein DFA_09008 [Cavenderia fasciculata]EGG16470.1 hypothetical protein DFA_09008 [Cavenderia fasciculata]|eukprot:XP_004354870.1 hypothetical protein DFA_09008 [Cavenderia fasciculata]
MEVEQKSSKMDRTIEFLENCDLNPKFKEQKSGSRNPLAGVITIIYFPLLIIYLWYTIQPQYGSLPSCCACALSSTPNTSWIYMANNDTCADNPQCKEFVQTQLKQNCDAALQYLPVPDSNISVNIAQIGCVGLKEGDTCDSQCMDISNRWISNLDFTFQDNRYQAEIRCPLQVGACDFKAVYSVQETSPHAVCRYPELSGILTRLGAGLGLLNGLLVTLRSMLRTYWNRIGVKDGGGGGLSDYWKGLAIGVIFNYFGVMYLTLATGINKRLRYGGQLGLGFLIIFFKSPFVVYLIIIFSQYWTPMSILFMLGCLGAAVIIRTTYNLVNLEIHSRNCVVISQDLEHIDHFEDQMRYVPPIKIKPVIYSQWRHFFEGFCLNVFAIYPLMIKHSVRRYSGLKAGFYCSISFVLLILTWVLLFSLDWWKYITFNFPFPLDKAAKSSVPMPPSTDSSSADGSTSTSTSTDSSTPTLSLHLQLVTQQDYYNYFMNHNNGLKGLVGSSSGSAEDSGSLDFNSNEHSILYKTAILQSLYFVITWVFIMVIVFHLSLFIKYLPERKNIIPSFLKKPQGRKIGYRLGFFVSFIPLVITYMCFFVFQFYPYVTQPLPASPSQCRFPGWSLIIPILGIIPSFFMLVFARTESFRSGTLSAIGVSLVVFNIGTSLLLFNYCLGSTQEYYYPWSWLVGLVGTFILIYGSIRPNQIFILDKKHCQGEDSLEDERLLQDKLIIS